MTPKQKLKSIEKKMQRIADAKPEIDFYLTTRNISDVNRYNDLSKEHFWLKFEIEHCSKCGKKL